MGESAKRVGRVDWIGLRVDRSKPMDVVQEAMVEEVHGIVNDRFKGGAAHRQVTLFELEYLDTIAKFLHIDSVKPEQTRRNIGVTGVNLHGLMGGEISIGECVLKITDDCTPCQRMETTVGPGAMVAMAGLAGVTATVVQSGKIKVGDEIRVRV